MTKRHPSSTMARTRPQVWAIVASSIGVLLVAVAVIGLARADGTPSGPSTGATMSLPGASSPRRAPTTTTTWAPATTTTTAPAPRPANFAPLRVRIPGIGVDSSLIPLGLNPDNTLEVPQDFGIAGWYIYRPVPGDHGPGIIAGHVDSRSGPGVFYRLKELQPGATIDVDRNDGTTAQFTVTGLEEHPKAAFPTDRVYGPTTGSELRLITCGGTFNWSTHHYNDNIIVFATLNQIIRP